MGFFIPLYSYVVGSYHHVWYSPLVFSLSVSDEYLVPVLSTLYQYFRLRASTDASASSPDALLLIIRSLHHLLMALDLPSGEGVLTH